MSKILALLLSLCGTVRAAEGNAPRQSLSILVGQMRVMPPALQLKKFGNNSADLNALAFGLSYATRPWAYGSFECWMTYANAKNSNFTYVDEKYSGTFTRTLTYSRFDTAVMLGLQIPIRLGAKTRIVPTLSLGPAICSITGSADLFSVGLCESAGLEFFYRAFYLEVKARVINGPVSHPEFSNIVSVMPGAGLGWAF